MRFIRPMALGGDVEYIYIYTYVYMYICVLYVYIYIMNLSIVKCCLETSYVGPH